MIGSIHSLDVVRLNYVFCVIFIENSVDLLFFLFFIFSFLGKKGGHKGRMRTYTSPEEIDAQMKEEKERKKVSCITKSDLNMKNLKKYG